MIAVDWHGMFVPTQSLVELFLRGTVMYLLILTGMRVFRREAGALSLPDLLVIVLVADAAQNALSAQSHSITEGAVLIATIYLWNFALDWLAFHSRWFYRALHPPPLPLVKGGQILRRNLRAQLLTLDDLHSQLRQQGVGNVAEVELCYLETDGHLSVIKRDPGKQNDQPGGRRQRGSIT
ncbi:MAG: DUF421 domain-containing protein [Gemmatimonadales bacterium]